MDNFCKIQPFVVTVQCYCTVLLNTCKRCLKIHINMFTENQDWNPTDCFVEKLKWPNKTPTPNFQRILSTKITVGSRQSLALVGGLLNSSQWLSSLIPSCAVSQLWRRSRQHLILSCFLEANQKYIQKTSDDETCHMSYQSIIDI